MKSLDELDEGTELTIVDGPVGGLGVIGITNATKAANAKWWDDHLEPLESKWIKAIDPTFEEKSIPDTLALELYSDVLKFGPNRDKVESLLKVFRQVLATCDEENGKSINELNEWLIEGLYEEDWSDTPNPRDVEHENLYHDIVSSTPQRTTLNLIKEASFASDHMFTCSQEHHLFDDYDLKEIIVTGLLIVAYDGSFEGDSDAEKARLYWKSKAPEFLSKLL